MHIIEASALQLQLCFPKEGMALALYSLHSLAELAMSSGYFDLGPDGAYYM